VLYFKSRELHLRVAVHESSRQRIASSGGVLTCLRTARAVEWSAVHLMTSLEGRWCGNGPASSDVHAGLPRLNARQ